MSNKIKCLITRQNMIETALDFVNSLMCFLYNNAISENLCFAGYSSCYWLFIMPSIFVNNNFTKIFICLIKGELILTVR